MDKKLQVLKEQQEVIFKQMASILFAIGAPVRIKIIHFLSQSPLTVEIISEKIEQSIANTSMHLRKMLAVKLLVVKNLGQKRLYSLHPSFLPFWEHCQDFIQKVDSNLALDTEKIYGKINWPYSKSETMMMLKKNQLFILDVRPEDEASHSMDTSSSCHIASSNIKSQIKKLPKKKKILVVCRGRLCALSAHTVNYLRENNFEAYRAPVSWFKLKEMLTKELV